jgi:hypothetical protein
MFVFQGLINTLLAPVYWAYIHLIGWVAPFAVGLNWNIFQ